jgi:hypothetical protein
MAPLGNNKKMDFSFIFIEGLPEGTTLVELSEIIGKKIPCEVTHMFQYKTSFGVIDFRAAIARLKTPVSNASVAMYKKARTMVQNKEIQLNFVPNSEPFETTFLFFNANLDEVRSALTPIIDQKHISNYFDITTHFIPITVVQASDRDVVLQKLASSDIGIEWKPVMLESSTFSFGNKIIDNLKTFSPLHDSFVEFRGQKYGISKPIASGISKTVADLNENETIHLPDMENISVCPIEDIIDFLWSKDISISFEKLPFFTTAANILKSNDLKKRIDNFIESELDPLSVSAFALSYDFVGMEDVPYEWAVAKIDKILECKECLIDFPVNQCLRFISSAESQSVDTLAQLIGALPLPDKEKIKQLKKLDKNKANKTRMIFDKYKL